MNGTPSDPPAGLAGRADGVPVTPLDHLPVKRGFRLRGAEMSRLETFADAAFAFALTLLVISIDEIPGSFPEFFAALRNVPVFAACFAIVVMFWLGHRTWSQRYGLDDGWSTFLTLVLVFTIMVYVYPLRVLLTEALSALTGDWVPSRFKATSWSEVRTLFVVYSAGWTACSLAILLLFRHALAFREHLGLDALELWETVTEIQAWALMVAVGVLSLLIGLVAQRESIALAGWIYMVLAIVMPLHGYLRGRKRPVRART
jgi:uncharacterized membrane protein